MPNEHSHSYPSSSIHLFINTQTKPLPKNEEECRKLLEDYKIIELDSFVTEENKSEMEEELFNELMARKSEIFV